MLRRSVLACLLFVVSCLPLGAQTADPAGVIAALHIPEMISVMRDEGMAYGADLEAELFPDAGGARWSGSVALIYDAPTMQRGFEAAFVTALGTDPAALAPIITFFNSDLGQRIVGLELEARRAMLDDSVDEAARAAFDDMTARNDPRLDLLHQFVAANDLIEQNVSGAMNANLAFYHGMADGGAFASEGMSEDEILSDVWSQEPDIRAETEGWLYPYLALAYGPLSDDEMKAYLDFSRTPAAVHANAALFVAFEAVFASISRDLGKAAAALLAGQDI